MAEIVLYDRTGAPVTYKEVETITTDTPEDGVLATFTHGVVPETVPEIALDFSGGNQTFEAGDGELLKKVVLKKPETLLPENITKGTVIAGVEGNAVGKGVSKTIDLDELDLSGGSQAVQADTDTLMSEVVIEKPDNLLPENIVQGTTICGVVGSAHEDEFGAYASGEKNRTWETLMGIPSYMFMSNQTLESEKFPNASYVSGYAFMSAKVTSVDFPTCKYINGYAFKDCSKLTTALFPMLSGGINAYAFAYCSKLTTALFPMLSGGINAYAFAYCSSLSDINIELCSNIGNYAFIGCSKLSEIVAAYCKSIGAYAFSSCIGLKTVSLDECKYISGGAFANCSNLEVMYAPMCSGIENYAFSKCAKLSDITISNATLTSYVVSGIASGKHLTIRGMPIMSQAAFSNGLMSGLSLMGVSTTYASVFMYCKSLLQVYNNINFIWTSYFYGCYSLKRVISPNLSRIGTNAFRLCSSLAYFSAKCVSYISGYAFGNCSNLSVIRFTSYTPLTQSLAGVFYSTPIEDSSYLGYFGSIYVPESLIASYQADSYWSAYSQRFAVTTPEIELLCEWEDL